MMNKRVNVRDHQHIVASICQGSPCRTDVGRCPGVIVREKDVEGGSGEDNRECDEG